MNLTNCSKLLGTHLLSFSLIHVYSLVGRHSTYFHISVYSRGNTTLPSKIDMNKKEEFRFEIEEQFFSRVQFKQLSILFSVEKIEV
jgi:hypothetical protein